MTPPLLLGNQDAAYLLAQVQLAVLIERVGVDRAEFYLEQSRKLLKNELESP